ncbi:MAG: hypothetical protein RIR28_112 [Pseudomonadota bacterium]|jgi:hypothetical protein
MTMLRTSHLQRSHSACRSTERRNRVLRLPIPRGPGVDLVDETNSKETFHEQ